ncbi:hypothetical protein ACFWPU_07480 [Streptomyces sp. NPDC058471]|uniref:hypothetical protein n=1 Tax=Streptomyces sp. NPDC058471 TaxID=3346516 RepID=UPI0036683CA4
MADRHTAARGDQLRARDADELRSELKLLAIRHRPLNEQPLQRLVSYRRREPDGFSDALATPGLPADVLHQ